ncbi:helix-turn-helix transcriptional regulator [Nocardiopsis tropica]|uniref:Helix-turn-helix transcriptional regulator n=1 Tax=Nocardiopsis tropica TaxID=109330 RepID=A0ABU7KPV7_9ACTN|nr:helix-turn-helix transcriptional regulator [Nocardiopsis umidischolae]MEE2051335.1 helix-turn-helix transcriptional regulator [Nocardiopsis umidischolae]
MKVTRTTRAQIAREASRIRADRQRHGVPVPAIVAQISRDLPVAPLEAWRLAYGWSRPHVVEAVADLYRADGLAPPGLSTAMLCRWEHGHARPGPDYIHALARVYGVVPERLGVPLPTPVAGWYGRRIPQPRQEHHMPSEYPELSAVADSINLTGPGAGARDLAHQALVFYELRYSDYPPRVLAAEVARCRSLLMDHRDTDTRRALGWMSALLGNLAHHIGDAAGALIHLGTAARVGEQVGDRWLTGWALGAQSMVALGQNRAADAVELADQAARFADTPVRRAQITAWCRLRGLAALGDTEGVRSASATARRHMDTAEEAPGRFGFDRAEFELHLAEAALGHDSAGAVVHASNSAGLKRVGSPGWAAATVVSARAQAAERDKEAAVGLGVRVLETVPAAGLRETTKVRLRHLMADLDGYRGADELREAARDRV